MAAVGVAVIAAGGSIIVALFGWNTARANRMDARISLLWARVDQLEESLDNERAYNVLLYQHILDGKPPPPPPRPTPRL